MKHCNLDSHSADMYIKDRKGNKDYEGFDSQIFLSNLHGVIHLELSMLPEKYSGVLDLMALFCRHIAKNKKCSDFFSSRSMTKDELKQDDYHLLNGKVVGDFLTVSDEAYILFIVWSYLAEHRTASGGDIFYEFPCNTKEIRFTGSGSDSDTKSLFAGIKCYKGFLQRVQE